MANLADINIVIRATDESGVAMNSFTSKLSATTRELKKTGNEIKAYHKLQAQGIPLKEKETKNLATAEAKYTELGGSLKKLTVSHQSALVAFTKFRWMLVNIAMAVGVAVGAYNIFIKPIAELEHAMKRVQKTTGMTISDINSLKQSFIDLSTMLPVSAKEMAEIGAVAGQLGISGIENISSFTSAVAMMTTATDMAAEEAATSLAKVANAFNFPIENVLKLGNVINELENTTAANTDEIVSFMKRTGAAASNLGMAVDTTAALGATLIAAGMQAERAGTRMRSVFTRMSSDAEKFSSFLGIKPTEWREELDNNPTEALKRLLNELNKIESPSERNSKAISLFGSIGGAAIQTLLNNYSDLIKHISGANKEIETGNSLLKETLIISNSLKGSQDKLSNEWDRFVQKGEGFAGAYRNIIDSFRYSLQALEGKSLLESIGIASTGILGMRALGEVLVETKLNKVIDDYSRLALELGRTDEEILEFFKVVEENSGENIDMLGSITLALEQLNSEVEKIDADKLISVLGISSNAGPEDVMRVIDSISQTIKNNNEIKSINDLVNEYTVILNTIEELKKGGILPEEIDEYEDATIALNTFTAANEENLKIIKDIYESRKGNIALINAWKDVLRIADKDLSKINKKISDFKKVISDANKEISRLISMRFIGELDFLESIYQSELAMKKFELANWDVLNTVKDVNSELKGETDAYKAWVESIDKSIESLIRQGWEEGKNVTSLVNEFQTKRMGFSQFTLGGDSKTSPEELELERMRNELRKLQLQNEVTYGDMHHQVDLHEQKYEDTTNNIVGSVQEVIDKIDAQRKIITDTTNSINSYDAQIKLLEDTHKTAEEKIDSLTGAQTDLNAAIKETIRLEMLEDIYRRQREAREFDNINDPPTNNSLDELSRFSIFKRLDISSPPNLSFGDLIINAPTGDLFPWSQEKTMEILATKILDKINNS